MKNRTDVLAEQALEMLLDQMSVKIGEGTAQPYELSQFLIAINSLDANRKSTEMCAAIAEANDGIDELFDVLQD